MDTGGQGHTRTQDVGTTNLVVIDLVLGNTGALLHFLVSITSANLPGIHAVGHTDVVAGAVVVAAVAAVVLDVGRTDGEAADADVEAEVPRGLVIPTSALVLVRALEVAARDRQINAAQVLDVVGAELDDLLLLIGVVVGENAVGARRTARAGPYPGCTTRRTGSR